MEMMINTTDKNVLSFQNKKLQNATMQIMQIAGKIRNNWFEVGAIIAMVDTQELYKDDGFSTVHEWTARAFNIKKSMSYDLLKIGKEYTREILSEKGRVLGYECNLLPEASEGNFTTTQVIRMLPAGHEKAQELVNAEIITPDMTSTQIAKVVKGLKDSEEPTEEPEETEATEAPQEPETEVSHEEWLRMTFDKITTQELIEELEKRGFYAVKEQGFIKIPSNEGSEE